MYDALVFRANAAQRLDVAIAAAGLSRREARRRIEAGLVVVNTRSVGVASRMLRERDRVVVFAEQPAVEVIAIHDDWIAVAKPSGVSSQPGESEESPASEIEALAAFLRSTGEKADVFVVHRLDRATSGVLLFARSDRAAAKLSDAFARGAAKKTYLAVVDGSLEHEEARIDAAIDRVDAKRFGVSENGRAATTIVRRRLAGRDFSVVEVHPLTGRTHQIRIHLAHIGHPVAGDTLYGGSRAERLLLHAWKLEVPDVGSLVAPLPLDFIEAIKEDGVSSVLRRLS